MEVAFGDDDLDRLETDAKFDAGFSPGVVKAFRKRMQMIRSAVDERLFYAMKSAHFEKLKGNREGQYSMRLNDQWRLILGFAGEAPNKTAVVISIEDYH
jgi:proteic killer suppression protein